MQLAAVALAGKPHSARLRLTQNSPDELRSKHGTELEKWWQERFDHAFNALTESEARYLIRTPDAATIRDRSDGSANRQGMRFPLTLELVSVGGVKRTYIVTVRQLPTCDRKTSIQKTVMILCSQIFKFANYVSRVFIVLFRYALQKHFPFLFA